MALVRLTPARSYWDLVAHARDDRGVVMVEFLLAFMPVFLLFLGTVQLALAGAAQLVVHHAATVAARSAAVVLEDDPINFGGVTRRNLGSGSAPESGIRVMLGLATPRSASPLGLGEAQFGAFGGLGSQDTGAQRGARMSVVREAAYVPLLALAPAPSAGVDESVAGALRSPALDASASALEYSRAASVITLHATVAAGDPPPREFPRSELVTARVTYFFRCGVPLVSTLICSTLRQLQAAAQRAASRADSSWNRLEYAESRGGLVESADSHDRFLVLEGTASFPSQTADYAEQEEE